MMNARISTKTKPRHSRVKELGWSILYVLLCFGISGIILIQNNGITSTDASSFVLELETESTGEDRLDEEEIKDHLPSDTLFLTSLTTSKEVYSVKHFGELNTQKPIFSPPPEQG